jgi:protein-S-isoprenylcysteine O-methyltransferase Ste14
MQRAQALAGSALFFLLAPGAVAGLVPFLITGWRPGEGAFLSASVVGGILIALSLAGLIDCFRRFAFAGGTPAPLAPAEELVVSGLYRHVRNPMYLAVTGLVLGQALLFASAALIAYAVFIWIVFDLFVIMAEEPRLRRDFPDAYGAYAKAVQRWIPRLTPWRAAAENS